MLASLLPMKITFYNAPFSSSTPVWSAMRELDVPHELVNFDLSKGETRTPEHLARNPNGKVPTLEVDGTPMFEALAIMQWLGEHFGVRQGLWPAADAPQRLTALSWTTWAYVSLGSVLSHWIAATSDMVPTELHNTTHAAHAEKGLRTLLSTLDGWFEQRKYILGEDYSLADLIVGSVILWARVCKAPVGEYPRVKAWVDTVAERPAIRAAWT